MKKLIILIAILGSLIVTNILVNNDNTQRKKESLTLSKAIALEMPLSSFEIIKNDNKIKLTKKELCYEIESIDYCANNTKVNFLKKFLTNKVKDIYENNKENLVRLGFNNIEKSNSLIINNKKTLIFGNINQYNEIYVLQANKIYKVDYYKGMLEITTRYWVDKSKPILSVVETDEFNVEIYSIKSGELCEVITHDDFLSGTKHSTLRNTFFDLYPSDINKRGLIYQPSNTIDQYKDKERKIFESFIESGMWLSLRDSHSGYSFKNNTIDIWKEDHVVYASERSGNLKFVIPNSVYDNINFYCKK